MYGRFIESRPNIRVFYMMASAAPALTVRATASRRSRGRAVAVRVLEIGFNVFWVWFV